QSLDVGKPGDADFDARKDAHFDSVTEKFNSMNQARTSNNETLIGKSRVRLIYQTSGADYVFRFDRPNRPMQQFQNNGATY
ncbi:MAG: hypothetical protein ACO3LE_11165, partial [Bdellovibrionota bacterium]